jgi:hypothetical protein
MMMSGHQDEADLNNASIEVRKRPEKELTVRQPSLEPFAVT